VPVEILFNLVMVAMFLLIRRVGTWPGQHFHIYLIAYGGFRFLHEFLREAPAVIGPFTGYQIAALAVAALGMVGFARRQNKLPATIPKTPAWCRSLRSGGWRR